jgi:hypothetical protein
VVACSETRMLIRLIQQSVHLDFLEVPDHSPGRLFEWHRSYFGAPGQVDWRTHANKARQRMDGREPLVAAECAALAVTLQMLEEDADNCRVQVFNGHAIDSDASLFADERQQQRQGVAVAGLSVSGEIALLQEEAANPRPQELFILHDRPPLRTAQSAG